MNLSKIPLTILVVALAAASVPGSHLLAARTGGSSADRKPSVQHIGQLDFSADEYRYNVLPGGGFRMILRGRPARLASPGRVVTATSITFDVPRGAKDVSEAHARGGVKMTMDRTSGGQVVAEGPQLDYARASGEIAIQGGVRVHSDLEPGSSVDATGARALVRTQTNRATLSGGVELTVVKPDTLEEPGRFTGESMEVDLRTGEWTLTSGPSGPTHGSLILKPSTKTQ